MAVREAKSFTPNDRAAWAGFVATRADAVAYHGLDWVDHFCEFYRYRNHSLLLQDESGSLRAVLPLCLGTRLSGRRELISMPHNAYGGILADGEESAREILDAAITLADRLDAESLQMRSFQRLDDPRLVVQSHKVHLDVDLSKGLPVLWRTLTNNLRSEIKKSYRSDIRTRIGGRELLPQFCHVYQRLERELGIPAHPDSFFRRTFDRFGDSCRIFNSYHEDNLAGSIMGLCHGGGLELVWGGTLAPFRTLSSTAMIFWRAACWAQHHSMQRIDFGRSTVGSGVYAFKKKWNAPERTLYYHYYLRKKRSPPDYSTANRRYKPAVFIWQHLPLPLTQHLGAKLIRYFF